MEDVFIEIGGKEYRLDISETPEDRYDGLSDEYELPDNEGMIFIFDDEGPHPMVMRGMEFAIDIIHLTNEGIITGVVSAEPKDNRSFSGSNDSLYVIELVKGQAKEQGIKIGTQINLPSEFTQYVADRQGIGVAKHGGIATLKQGAHVKKYIPKVVDIAELPDHLQVLDHNGEIISNIKLGARIFSIPHTKQLVDTAMQGDTPENLKKLGQMMIEIIIKQDTQKPEYST